MLKIYQTYIVKSFLSKFIYISIVFFSLAIILSLLEEISFFKDSDENFLYPYLLTLLNAPSTLFEIFPFIFLLSTQFLLHDFFKKNEIDLLKNSGLSNFKIIKLLFYLTLVIGIFNVVIFYNFSSVFKFHYSNIKNNLSNDNKYLAMVNESGLWIKDEINSKKYIIKANKIENNFLLETIINEFDHNFKLEKTIQSKKINIKNNEWILYDADILLSDNSKIKKEILKLKTNFNEKKIKNLFNNISTLNLFELFNLKKDFIKFGYSTDEIRLHLLKILSLPLFYGILTILSSVVMFSISKDRNFTFHLIIGILMSVTIYYINFIFNSLGNNSNFPIYLSIFFPLVFLSILSIIGLININEK